MCPKDSLRESFLRLYFIFALSVLVPFGIKKKKKALNLKTWNIFKSFNCMVIVWEGISQLGGDKGQWTS